MNNLDFDALILKTQGYNTMDNHVNSGISQTMTQQSLQNIQTMQTPTVHGYMPQSPVLPIFQKKAEEEAKMQQAQQAAQQQIQIYVLLNNEQKGPFSLEQIKGFYNAGMINESTFAWIPGMQNWADLQTCLSFLNR